MAEEPDRLSQLPDDLLRHILHLAPCREAATTPVLSRRWRGVWPPPTGAVKIDIPSASLRAAEEALAASHGPVERLAIAVAGDLNNYVGAVGDVLSHPASRGVQDVRITYTSRDGNDSLPWMPYQHRGEFKFSFVSVPSAALRVLHITNCSDVKTPLPTSTSFPCLEVLRLRRCALTLQTLQDMVLTSPQLAGLQLEYVHLDLLTGRYINSWGYDGWGYDGWDSSNSAGSDSKPSFCCPAITTLVLLNCVCEPDNVAVELDIPRVQHFKYTGKINQITLTSPLPDVRRAYIHILDSRRDDVENFWNFLTNFSDAKVLKLKLDCDIDYVAAQVIGGNQSAQSIRFCVERLEIDAQHNPMSEDTGVAIGNFLQCCPALRDLRLKLNIAVKRNAQLEFHKSINHFRHRRDRPVVAFCGDKCKFEVSDIPGLSDKWIHFSCLRLHVKRLSLQFHMYNPNCIGPRLVKFFVERGMALEEMYIHDGNTKMWQHINCKISGYSVNPQPISEYQVLERMSQELSMNQFNSSKISGSCHPHKLEVRRTNPWVARGSFTIVPLADA